MYMSLFACMCMYPQWFGKNIVRYEMWYCMYVACILYVCIMTRMIQVGRARPQAGALSSAAAPGRGCTVIAAVTRTRTYVTLIAVQIEHATWFFLMLLILFSKSFDHHDLTGIGMCQCAAQTLPAAPPWTAWQSHGQSQWRPSSVSRGRYLVHTCRYRQIPWHTCRCRNIDIYMQIQMH